MSWRQAVGIGVAQCLALWPGFSRSAATILGGLGMGLDRRSATEFSFFLAVPTHRGRQRLRPAEERAARSRRATRSGSALSPASSRSRWPGPRSAGCCATSPRTTSASSRGTASRSARSCSWRFASRRRVHVKPALRTQRSELWEYGARSAPQAAEGRAQRAKASGARSGYGSRIGCRFCAGIVSRSFFSARASSWRTRSRDRPSDCPICSSVCSSSPPRP